MPDLMNRLVDWIVPAFALQLPSASSERTRIRDLWLILHDAQRKAEEALERLERAASLR